VQANNTAVYAPTLRTFYREEMVAPLQAGTSRSPLKPRLLIERGGALGFVRLLQVDRYWQPFGKEDFLQAHTRDYVEAFFNGDLPLAESNSIGYSPAFADSVRYTNASLYHAIAAANRNPGQITFSPTSGFHHAQPERGGGFCTFSGQVIASLKLWHDKQLVGAYVDLDGHYGNSIEDSRAFAPELDQAVPRQYHINPAGSHRAYLHDLSNRLVPLKDALLEKRVHYVVLCHGADSHEWDDLGGQLDTEEWLEAARLVYATVREAAGQIGHVPFTLALFGGYRSDHYASVLDLHWASLCLALKNLAQLPGDFNPKVARPRRKIYA
jgi:acetoin utilization deacetylase AcuC-like enzyme